MAVLHCRKDLASKAKVPRFLKLKGSWTPDPQAQPPLPPAKRLEKWEDIQKLFTRLNKEKQDKITARLAEGKNQNTAQDNEAGCEQEHSGATEPVLPELTDMLDVQPELAASINKYIDAKTIPCESEEHPSMEDIYSALGAQMLQQEDVNSRLSSEKWQHRKGGAQGRVHRWSDEASKFRGKYYDLFLPPPQSVSYPRRAELGACRVEVDDDIDLQQDDEGNYKMWIALDIRDPGVVHPFPYALSITPKDPASRLGMRCRFINKNGEQVQAYYQKRGEQAVFRANTLVEILADEVPITEIVHKERRYICAGESTLGGIKGFEKGKYTSAHSKDFLTQDPWRLVPIEADMEDGEQT